MQEKEFLKYYTVDVGKTIEKYMNSVDDYKN